MRKLRCLELPALQALHAAPSMQVRMRAHTRPSTACLPLRPSERTRLRPHQPSSVSQDPHAAASPARPKRRAAQTFTGDPRRRTHTGAAQCAAAGGAPGGGPARQIESAAKPVAAACVRRQWRRRRSSAAPGCVAQLGAFTYTLLSAPLRSHRHMSGWWRTMLLPNFLLCAGAAAHLPGHPYQPSRRRGTPAWPPTPANQAPLRPLGAHRTLPPGLEAASPAELAARLEPLLPVLQQHLVAAAAVVKQPGEDADARVTDGARPGRGGRGTRGGGGADRGHGRGGLS